MCLAQRGGEASRAAIAPCPPHSWGREDWGISGLQRGSLLWAADGGCAEGEDPTGVEVMQPCAHVFLLAAGSGGGA